MKTGLIIQHALSGGAILRLARTNGSGFILSVDDPRSQRVCFAAMSVEEFARFQGEVATVRETETSR